ncbi:uncharacterized protein [Drosophila kikkawai]|uniref:Uncharacterized protein n=1 Tax=Drosophila kikkawai TaxID=30033 RepID=A0A6P4IQJ5_DROKI|nr:mucin-5AC [Drosophila kikkawai]
MLLAAAGLPAYDAGKLNSGAGSGSVGSGGGGTPTTSSVASRPSAASALMKTLSVRLHRGTEFIKDTVQKALVMSAPTPVASVPAASVAPLASAKLLDQQGLKRKLSGAGGLMGCSGISSVTSISASTSRSHYVLAPATHHSQVQVQPNVPTAAFLRTYTVAPTALHRSAAARKRNPSTDSLLMDLCLFKPIRPMPITPIKINKFRSFELKRPKFVSAANPDSEDDEEDDDDDLVHKPKLSNLTLPTNEVSAFVPMPYVETTSTAIIATNPSSSNTTTATTSRSRSRSHNTHTSGSAPAITNPKPKRRRRAPKFSAKKRCKAPQVKTTSPADGGTEAKAPAKRKATVAAASGEVKRSRGESIASMSTPAVVKKAPTKRKANSGSGQAKRSRGGSPPITTSTSSTDGATAVKNTLNRKAATVKGAAAKRSRGSSEAAPLERRPSPPMTRLRARQQISASK